MDQYTSRYNQYNAADVDLVSNVDQGDGPQGVLRQARAYTTNLESLTCLVVLAGDHAKPTKGACSQQRFFAATATPNRQRLLLLGMVP